MELKNIPWKKKQLIVFFGDEAKARLPDIIEYSKPGINAFVDIFPSDLCHPWEHIDYIEGVIKTINRDPENRRFVITTNSSYIIDHLVNLMKGAKIRAHRKFTRCGDARAFIEQKHVSVYVCTKGEIKNALGKDGFIDWNNLSEVAEWLSNVYFEMERY